MRKEDLPQNPWTHEEQAWGAVAHYFSTALEEVSVEVGGTELRDEIMRLAYPEEGVSLLPDPAALERLESYQEGSLYVVLQRSNQIMRDTHARAISDVERRLADSRKIWRPEFWRLVFRSAKSKDQ